MKDKISNNKMVNMDIFKSENVLNVLKKYKNDPKFKKYLMKLMFKVKKKIIDYDKNYIEYENNIELENNIQLENNIETKNENNMIFIDWNNLINDIFKKEKDKIKCYDDLQKYQDYYFDMFAKMINNYSNYFNTYFENIYVIVDGYKKNNWRRIIDGEYKNNKTNISYVDDLRFNFMDLMTKTLLPLLIKQLKINEINDLHYEADDVIAVLSKYLSNKNITIISNDRDYIQLLINPNIKLYDIDLNDLECEVYKNFNIDNVLITQKREIINKLINDYMVKKYIEGDSSHKISNCFDDFKKAREYSNNLENFFFVIKNNEKIKEKFEYNQKLMNFDYIPEDIKKGIINIFNLTKKKIVIND